MGAVMGGATVFGPLVGGAFTSNVTWRWCFYINLPFGALAAAGIFFFVKFPTSPAANMSTLQKLAQLDAPGTSLLIPGVVCLLLALQWGGQTYAVRYLVYSCAFLICKFNKSLPVEQWAHHRIARLNRCLPRCLCNHAGLAS
jgi:MFS family permease